MFYDKSELEHLKHINMYSNTLLTLLLICVLACLHYHPGTSINDGLSSVIPSCHTVWSVYSYKQAAHRSFGALPECMVVW